MSGVLAQSGTVGDDEESKSIPDELRRWDNRPMFANVDARLSTAEKDFKSAIDQYGKTGAGDYARLQLAGVEI